VLKSLQEKALESEQANGSELVHNANLGGSQDNPLAQFMQNLQNAQVGAAQ
jgi:hypothetical protein